MAQYKKGDLIVDEKNVGVKTAEDWKEQGFELYTPASATPTPTPAPTPTVTPVAPVVAPITPVNQISAADLTNTQPDLTAEAADRDKVWSNIESTVNANNWNAPANNAFLDALMRYKFGKRNINGQVVYGMTEDERQQAGKSQFGLIGLTVGQAMDKLGLTSKLSNMGLWETANEENGQAGAGEAASSGPKTSKDRLNELLNEITGNATTPEITAKQEEASLWRQQAKVIEGQKNELKNAMNAAGLADTTENAEISQKALDIKTQYSKDIQGIKNQAISMTHINRQLSQLTEDVNTKLSDLSNEATQASIKQTLANAQNTYNYNQALIQYSVVSGLATEAQSLATSMAQDLYNNRTQTIQVLQMMNQIEQQEAEDLKWQASYELDMSSTGYTLIAPENYEAAVRQYGESMIYTNPYGQSYLKPDGEPTNDIQWGIIGEDENGNKMYGFIDTTNKTITSWSFEAGLNVPENGVVGGQCGNYIHSIMDGTPQFGDTWESKQAAMNVKPEGYVPQVGDIVAFKTNLPYGHVAVVTSVNADGSYSVTESNYNLDEKVSNGRVVNANDPNFLGAYRGATLKRAGDEEVLSYVDLVKKGKLTVKEALDKIDEKKKAQLTSALAKEEIPDNTKEAQAEKAIEMVALTDEILDHEGMTGTVGPYGISRWTPFSVDKAERQEFIGKVQQLADNLTLAKLIEVKGQGATFGALSDSERAVIERAATPINQWAIKDDNGQIIGYEISEERFIKEINRIKKEFEQKSGVYNATTGTTNNGINWNVDSVYQITPSGVNYEIIEE